MERSRNRVVLISQACRASSSRRLRGERKMGKGLILWLLGVPGIVVIGLLLFHVI
jgi:hypothetical protein